MNVGVDYDDEIERNNMSNRVEEVISEEANELNIVNERLPYSEALNTISVKNAALSTHSPQECVEEPQKTTIGQEKYDQYHGHGKHISRTVTGTTKMMTQIRCPSKITRTSGDRRNVIHQSTRGMRHGYIPYILLQNERELVQVQSGSIPYVLVYNECKLIQIHVSLTQFDTSMELILVNGY